MYRLIFFHLQQSRESSRAQKYSFSLCILSYCVYLRIHVNLYVYSEKSGEGCNGLKTMISHPTMRGQRKREKLSMRVRSSRVAFCCDHPKTFSQATIFLRLYFSLFSFLFFSLFFSVFITMYIGMFFRGTVVLTFLGMLGGQETSE